MLGIKSIHASLLTRLGILPHDEKRKEELAKLKQGPNRLTVLRIGISCEEAPIILESNKRANVDDLLLSKFGENGSSLLQNTDKFHERDSRQAYVELIKVRCCHCA